MEIYLKLFEVLFPVFFIVGIGYYLGKKNPKIDTTFITSFAANIGTPAMVIYAITSTGITFKIFQDYFWYYLLAICLFSFVGSITLYLLNTKDIIRELPPLILPNTGNMGLPICMFAYGSKGLGVSASISSLIILLHFTLGVFLADRKFNLDVILKNPPFYAIIFSVIVLFYEIRMPVFVVNGGESSCPWEEGTLKRQAASITSAEPILLNQPPEEPAVFTVTLGNLSETGDPENYFLKCLVYF